MTQELWTNVDRYITDLFALTGPALDAAVEATQEAGMPSIQVAPNQGMLLSILAQAIQARRILEVGTLGGYSTIWLARALPEEGSLITLEADPRHAEVAQANVARAGLAGKVEIRVGPAMDTLPQLAAEGLGPFDLVFLDADKQNYSGYLQWALRMTRRGSLIVADNVVRDGAVIDPATKESSVQGVRHFNAALAGETRLTTTIIQTVGSKGYDGLSISLVTAEA